MSELSEEQRRELEVLLAEDWAQDAYTEAVQVFAREGWDDPRMDVYNALDPQY